MLTHGDVWPISVAGIQLSNDGMSPKPLPQLIPGKFIAVLPELAVQIGLNQAIVVQQLHFLLSVPGGREITGEHWVFNTYEQWQSEHFPWWHTKTIQNIFTRLEEMLIVESCQPDGGMSRKKYYRLNRGMWAKMLSGTLQTAANTHQANLAGSSDKSCLIHQAKALRSTTETTVQRLPSDKGSRPRLSGSERISLEREAERLRRDYEAMGEPPFPPEQCAERKVIRERLKKIEAATKIELP